MRCRKMRGLHGNRNCQTRANHDNLLVVVADAIRGHLHDDETQYPFGCSDEIGNSYVYQVNYPSIGGPGVVVEIECGRKRKGHFMVMLRK